MTGDFWKAFVSFIESVGTGLSALLDSRPRVFLLFVLCLWAAVSILAAFWERAKDRRRERRLQKRLASMIDSEDESSYRQ